MPKKQFPMVTFEVFAKEYCERQDSTPEALRVTLFKQKLQFECEGWMLLECQMMDSSWLGSLVILPYGGKATHREPPGIPISPRGLASDMSVVKMILPADEIR